MITTHTEFTNLFLVNAAVFRKILSNPLNSSIYLRGIHHEELESILQFIYLGEATFYHERMNEFLNVAKDLDIKEIGKNVVDDDEESEGLNDTQNFEQENLEGSEETQGNNVITSSTSTSEEVDINDSSYSLIHGDKKPFKCLQCDFQAANKGHFRYHLQSKHEGIKYPCQQCDYLARTSTYLQHHMKSKHEGIKYPCQQCDYQATSSSHLQVHIRSKHEGIKYPCQQCDYQATQACSLKVHIKSKHEGTKYPCQQCDYQATASSSLQLHIKSKHEGIKYPCQLCDYQGSYSALRMHVKVKH